MGSGSGWQQRTDMPLLYVCRFPVIVVVAVRLDFVRFFKAEFLIVLRGRGGGGGGWVGGGFFYGVFLCSPILCIIVLTVRIARYIIL